MVFIKSKFLLLFSVVILAFAQNIIAQENNQKNEVIDFGQFYDFELFQWTAKGLNFKNENSGIGFGINDTMKDALLKYPDSSIAYNSYRKKIIPGSILLYGGFSLVMGGYVFHFINDAVDAKSYYESPRPFVSIGLMLTGLIVEMIGSSIFSSGVENLFSAVNMYNRNKLSELNK